MLTDIDRDLTKSDDLFIESVETEGKKENRKKISKKREAKSTMATIPNKFQLNIHTLNMWKLKQT